MLIRGYVSEVIPGDVNLEGWALEHFHQICRFVLYLFIREPCGAVRVLELYPNPAPSPAEKSQA